MFLAEVEDLRALLFWLVFILLPVLGRLMGWIATKVSAAGKEGPPVRRKVSRAAPPASTASPRYASSTESSASERSVYAAPENDPEGGAVTPNAERTEQSASTSKARRYESSTGGPATERNLYSALEDDAAVDVHPESAAPGAERTAQHAPTTQVPVRGLAADRIEVHREYKTELESMFGGESSGSSLAQTSFGTAARFAAFDRDMAKGSLAGELDVPSNVPPRRRERSAPGASDPSLEHPSLAFDRTSIRNAIVWSEILAPPVSLREEGF